MSSEDKGLAEKDESSQANKNEELSSSSRVVDEPNTIEPLQQEDVSSKSPSQTKLKKKDTKKSKIKGAIKRGSKRSKKKKKREDLDSDEESSARSSKKKKTTKDYATTAGLLMKENRIFKYVMGNILQNDSANTEETNQSELKKPSQADENQQSDSMGFDAQIAPVDAKQIAAIDERDKNEETVPEQSNVNDELAEEERNKNMAIAPEKSNETDRLPEEERDKNAETVPDESNMKNELPEEVHNENMEIVTEDSNGKDGLPGEENKENIELTTEKLNVKDDFPEEKSNENAETVPEELTLKDALPEKVSSKANLSKGRLSTASKYELGKNPMKQPRRKERTTKRPKKKKKRKVSSDSDEEFSARLKEKMYPAKVSSTTLESFSEVSNTIPISLFVLDGIIVAVAIILFVVKPTCKVMEGGAIYEDHIDGDLSEINESSNSGLPDSQPSNTETPSIQPSPIIPTVSATLPDLLTQRPLPLTSQSLVSAAVVLPSPTAVPNKPAPTGTTFDFTPSPEDIIPQNSAEYECGKNTAPYNRWSWTVRLRKLSNIAQPICGAAIVSPRHALSVCHCIEDRRNLAEEMENYRIGIGNEAFDSRKAYHVSKFRFHPACSVDQNVYDLLLITLQEEVKFDSEVQPACLPPYEQTPTAALNCWVSGWLKSTTLFPYVMKQHKVGIVPEKECQNRLQDNAEVESLTPLRKEIAVCAENKNYFSFTKERHVRTDPLREAYIVSRDQMTLKRPNKTRIKSFIFDFLVFRLTVPNYPPCRLFYAIKPPLLRFLGLRMSFKMGLPYSSCKNNNIQKLHRVNFRAAYSGSNLKLSILNLII